MERAEKEDSFSVAFDQLFLRCGRVAYRLLGDRWAAEDIAGEAMARAFAHWDKIGDLDHRDAWVLRVATNLAIDRGRRRVRHGELNSTADVELMDIASESAVNQVTVLRVTLLAALGKLPRRQREVIVLRHMTGLSETEVAAATGMALGTVKTHLRRGLSSLRNTLGADWGPAHDV